MKEIAENVLVLHNKEVSTYRNFEQTIFLCKLKDFLTEIIDHNVNIRNISILELKGCDLTQVPHYIKELPLKKLILSNNKLQEVPVCVFTGLEKLQFLDLSNNDIKNFDIEPVCWATLQVLKLNNNNIYNVPQWILVGRCPNLIEFIYSFNNVIKLKTNQQQFQIKKVVLQCCNLRDVDFIFFQNIVGLQYLDISNDTEQCKMTNKFTDVDGLFVKPKWINLEVLILNNLILSILPEGILWIASLTELYLVNCDLSWISQDIHHLQNLQILDISKNSVCSIPDSISNLENLRIIKASYNHISSVPKFLNHLEILDLYNNQMENYLEGLPGLIDFELNYINTADWEFYADYKEKLQKYRMSLCDTDAHREYGQKMTPLESSKNSDYSKSPSSLEYAFSDISENCFNDSNEIIPPDIVELNWDEEISTPQRISSEERNPFITSSDDEWQGIEEVKSKKVINNNEQNKSYIDYEEWMFCDAD